MSNILSDRHPNVEQRERGIIKARACASIAVTGIWMRAYPIIGCLHLSCYPRGRGYPIEQGGDFNKPQRQAAGRGGGGGRGRGVCVRVCVVFISRRLWPVGRFIRLYGLHFRPTLEYIGLHKTQQFHRQLKGESSITFSWWANTSRWNRPPFTAFLPYL